MITKRGAEFALAAVALFFIASSTRVGWAFIADAVLWGTIAVSAVAPWATVMGLKVSRKATAGGSNELSGPVVGDEAELSIRIENRSLLPRFHVSLGFNVNNSAVTASRYRAFVRSVRGRVGAESVGKIVLRHRGVTELGSITVESGAPLGLFRKRKLFRQSDRVFVYPRWYAMSIDWLLAGTPGDETARARSRAGGETSGSRRYVFGDPRRHVHWRNSARTGRLMVREFDAPNGLPLIILLLTSSAPEEDEIDRFEDAVSLAASVSRPAIASGGHVFIAKDEGTGPALTTWSAVMEQLAVISPKNAMQAATAPAMFPAGARVLAFMTGDAVGHRSLLDGLVRSGCSVTVVSIGERGGRGAEAGEFPVQGVRVIACPEGDVPSAVRALEGMRGGRNGGRKTEGLGVGPHAPQSRTGAAR